MGDAGASGVWTRAGAYEGRVALEQGERRLRYEELLELSARVATALLGGREDLAGERVAFLAPAGIDWVTLQWGIWRAGGVAVPLATAHPPPELDYVLADTRARQVVAHPDFAERLAPVARARDLEPTSSSDLLSGRDLQQLPTVSASRPAMMVYTSGTTGGPKGVVSSHAGLDAQMSSLVEAWGWSADDRILATLPLHHVHGIVNVVGCGLRTGATCVMRESFDAREVWSDFVERRLTLFMGVPTMYFRLIRAWEEAGRQQQEQWSQACRGFRLMVSGSAALPTTVLERWREISGHVLLERYGMTETGMILSNPLVGERVPGAVGQPLPGVEVRVVADDGRVLEGPGEGEVQVRGAGVFEGYWEREEATREAFDGSWFRTGDITRYDGETYRLLGRASVDIVKTGGYKVSALEIEEVLRGHPAVADCAVVGLPDEEWGERLAAALVRPPGSPLPAPGEMRAWAKLRLAAYKVPRQLQWLDELPRNALGKVTKPAVRELLASPQAPGASAGVGPTAKGSAVDG
jgi:malonyl-CoA/methylmalonyl-CoA synthetase